MAKKTDDAIPFVLRGEWEEELEMLSMEERGELFTMLFQYSRTRETPATENRILVMVFQRWRKWLDQDYEKLMEKRKRRQDAGRAGGLAKARNAKETVANCSNAKESVAMLPFATENLANLASYQLPVTSIPVRDTKTISSTIEKEKIEKERDDLASIIRTYESEMQIPITPAVSNQIQRFMVVMSADVIQSAIRIAVENGKPYWRYINAVLTDWRDAGVRDAETLSMYQNRRKPNGRNDEANRESVSPYSQPQLSGITILG